ncbi:inorganic pyrophosphatase TTM2-like [Arachis duranensis]|uniref:Inorganic pyrophosphatase TTM2-like n=1 Tax=Arachis duranensis TaxID=130453 RepID=A0A6P5NLL0_ARADU|nr:inorganic pyrophosphatase TTM2-like [Arachis duranensis]
MTMRHKQIGLSRSFTNLRDKNQAKLGGYVSNNRDLHERNDSDESKTMANEGAITQLLERISCLYDRMDDFTNYIEEMNFKLSLKKICQCQQNMHLQVGSCNGCSSTSYFITSLSNGSSVVSPPPTKEFILMDEVVFLNAYISLTFSIYDFLVCESYMFSE